MFGLFTKTEKEVLAKTSDKFSQTVEFAETAWPLPSGYFFGWAAKARKGGKPFGDVTRSGGVGRVSSQSPLHRISDGCHPFHSEELREGLWSNKRYRRAIAWVFSELSPEDSDVAVKAATRLLDHGYWQPMAATILKAHEEGLIGISKWDVKEMEV